MKEKIITISIFFIIIASSFYFGFNRMKTFSGVDEPYWSYHRVPHFWESIAKGKWKSTNISDKPGITIATVSGIGLPFIGEDPRNYGDLRYEPKTIDELHKIESLYFYLRIPVFLFTLAILPLFYFLIKKILGKNTARLSIILIGLSPILLGISLIVNADSMLWILTALSSLSLFVFLKNNEKKYLIISGIFLGLSIITKYVANILFIYFFLLFLLEYIFYMHRKVEVSEYMKKSLVNYFLLSISAFVTAFIFFPAAWVKKSVLINATIGNDVFSSTWPLFVGIIGLIAFDILVLKTKFSKIVFDFLAKYKNFIIKTIISIFLIFVVIVLLHVYTGVHFFDIHGLITSPKGIGDGGIPYQYGGAITADFYSLMFSISPLVLFFILFATINTIQKKEPDRNSITVIYILFFILIFYLGSTVNDVTTVVRYQIMTYPLAFILSAIGISWFLENNFLKKYLHPVAAYILLSLVLLSSLYLIKPDFLAYASEILPKNLIVNFKGMGEGSFEAASYLNDLPDAYDMTIWSDKGAVCERFVGKCFVDFKDKTFEENQFDYFIVSTDRMSRSLKMSNGNIGEFNSKKLYSEIKPEFEVIIGGRKANFVKVIKNTFPKK